MFREIKWLWRLSMSINIRVSLSRLYLLLAARSPLIISGNPLPRPHYLVPNSLMKSLVQYLSLASTHTDLKLPVFSLITYTHEGCCVFDLLFGAQRWCSRIFIVQLRVFSHHSCHAVSVYDHFISYHGTRRL